MLETLRAANPHLTIKTLDDPAFQTYGVLLPAQRFAGLEDRLLQWTETPKEGSVYVADDPRLHDPAWDSYVQNTLFGEMEIQIGYCNGVTRALNALEYHQCNEVIVPATDCALMLAPLWMVVNHRLDSSAVECFFIQKGQAVSLFSTTMHYAPTAVDAAGYKAGILLQKGTNAPLAARDSEDPTLRLRNKWLIAHPEAPVAQNGGYVGIYGENIKLHPAI